nr:DUF2252 domain-containing protein [Pseudomonas sp. FW305-70]
MLVSPFTFNRGNCAI